jgi:hypothetical protein
MICSRCAATLVEERSESTCFTSGEPDYWDEEVHLGSESFVDPNITFRYLAKDR